MRFDESVEPLKRSSVDVDRSTVELRKHSKQLAPLLIAVDRGERHRHHATEHAGPEHFEEALVVSDAQDHRMPRAQTTGLQCAQQAQGALPQASKAQHTLLVVAVDEGDVAVVADAVAQDGPQGFELSHGGFSAPPRA